jgi:hypothetical protein
MSSERPPQSDNAGDSASNPSAFTQSIHHPQVGALVPERVSRGVMSTGVMVLQGPHEFVLDFVLRMNRPHQVVARVVLPIALMPGFINAVRENITLFESKFGSIKPLPTGTPPAEPPSVEEIYKDLKLSDDVLSGAYADHVLIVHSPAEFCFEFITRFFPRAAVSARVLMSAPHIPSVLQTLSRSWQQFQQKHGTNPPQPPISERN